MYIIIVEDDHSQGEWIEARFRSRFRDVRVVRVKTEYEFRCLLPGFSDDPPDLVIIDVMLRWTDPAPGQPPRPDRVKSEGPFKAGLRCQELFNDIPSCAAVPVILYTVLEEKDLRRDLAQLKGMVVHLRKDSDIEPLLDGAWRLTSRKDLG